MTNQTYNGWSNKQTWLVNLHFDETISMIIEDLGTEDMSKEVLGDIIRDELSEYIIDSDSNNKSIFLDDVMAHFINDVNWAEIADHY